MPLQIDANGDISTPTGDTGTYTWADIVALNSSKLTTLASNIFRWTGIIIIKGNSTLNITNITLFLDQGIITVDENAVVNFGETTSLNGCQIIINKTSGNKFSIHFQGDGNTTSRMNLYGTTIELRSLPRNDIYVSNLIDCMIRSTISNPNSSEFFIYLQNNAVIRNCKFQKIRLIEIQNNPTLDNITITDSYSSFLNWSTQTIINIPSFTGINLIRDYSTYNGAFRFINPISLNLANGRTGYSGTPNNTYITYKAFQHYLKIVSNNNAVNNALVTYAGNTEYNNISNSEGNVPVFTLDVANNTGQVADGNLTVAITDTFVRSIKSYLHLLVQDSLTVNSPLGNQVFPFIVNLTVDTAITETNTTTVSNYTGISHSTNTITITALRTLNEIYDSRKLYWRNNNVNVPYLEGDTLNLNGTNLVVNGVNLVSSSKFRSVKTTGTITYLNNGNTSFPTKDSTGFRYKIYGLPTKVNSLPILRIKRVNTNTITYPTIVNGESYITLVEGEDYIIRADARGYIASAFLTINTNTSSELQINLIEILDSNNNPVYGNGIQAEKDLITYDNATNTIFVTYNSTTPSISLSSAVDKLEEILATTTGLEITAHPVYRNNKLVFIRDILTNNQSTLKIKPAVGNTGDPELVFQVEREGDITPYNLFDFSTSNGRIIKYPTTVNIADVNETAIATSVWNNSTRTLTSSASLTPEQEAKLNNLDVAVSSRLAATSYSQAPTTTQIRTEIESSTVLAKEATTASRASQASVNLIPTNTLLTTDNRLNNLDASISTRATLTTIEASTIIAKQDTLNTVNTKVTAIPTNTLLTTDSRLNNLDTTISSRLASNNYVVAPTTNEIWNNNTRSLTEGVTVITNNDKTNYELSSNSINTIWNTLVNSLTVVGSIGKRIVDYLDTTITSRLSSSSYTNAPTVTDIRNELNTELNRIDTSISSRSSQTSVNNIPTNTLLTNDVRLNNLDVTVSSRLANSNYINPLNSSEVNTIITNALNIKDVVTNTDLNNDKTEIITAINNIEINGLTTEQDTTLTSINLKLIKLSKLRGLVNGISVIAKAPITNEPGYLRTSDNDINLTITKTINNEEVLSGN